MAAHILVAGGGIGGIATALALARRGHRIDVLEQSPAFGEIGAGVQLGPNATRRLIALNLAQPLKAVAAQPEALVIRCADTGSAVRRCCANRLMRSSSINQRTRVRCSGAGSGSGIIPPASV